MDRNALDRNAQLLSRFEAEYQEPNSLSRDRRMRQMRVLADFAPTLGYRALDELTAADISTYIGQKLAAGMHPNTARSYQMMIRAFVTWASRAKLIDLATTIELKSVRCPRGSSGRSTPKPYKPAEVHAFYARLAELYPAIPATGKGSHALAAWRRRRGPLRRGLLRHARRLQFEAQVSLALELGLRRIEIHSLTIPAMHHENEEVVVLTAKQGPGHIVKRAIPHTAHSRQVVMEWLDFRRLLEPPHDAPWLSLNPRHTYEQQTAALAFSTMSHALGCFGYWDWHRFRHTCATEWLRAGVPLEQVRVYMGHGSITETLAYAEILKGDVTREFRNAEAAFATSLGLAA